MALPSAGNTISLQQVNVELGNSATASINMGSSSVRSLFGISDGAIDMSDGFGKSSELGLTASAASSANLQTLFDANTSGSWTGSTAKRYTINSGTTMGLITVPASMGGTLIIDHAGAIQGTGGSANGGAGGTAMTIQSTGVTINMASGSSISGGGSGGGQGGTGGQGKVSGSVGTQCKNCDYFGGHPSQYCTASARSNFASCHQGSCCEQGEDNCTFYTTTCYVYTYYNGTSGGAGGVGQGYGQSATNGSSGSSAGNNAGTGGSGGNGASFGNAGATGSTGANGNHTNGAAGSAGGAAGRAITFSGVSAYTIIGTASGTIHGAYT
jgi:hypothetical protein